MKTINLRALLTLVMCCIIFTSCDSEKISPSEELLAADNALDARAIVYRNSSEHNYDDPNWYKFVDSCNDEPLRLIGGTLRVQSTVIVKGTHVTIQSQSNSSRLRVLNEATGTEYVGSFTSKLNEKYDFITYYPYSYKETLSIVLTAPGRNNNIQIKADVHYKVNENGEITMDVDNYRENCAR